MSPPIRVHIACDDPAYRKAIAGLLADDAAIEIVKATPEGGEGARAIEKVQPDVILLAVPPGEDVNTHTRLYQSAAGENAAMIGFCTIERQAEAYRRAAVHTVVFPEDTAETLRASIRSVHEAHKSPH